MRKTLSSIASIIALLAAFMFATAASASADTYASSAPAITNTTFETAANDDFTCTFWGTCYGDRDIWGTPTGCDIWGNCYGDRNVYGDPYNQCNIWGDCYGETDIWGNNIDSCGIWGCSNGNNSWWRSSNDSCSFYGNCSNSSQGWSGGTGWGNSSGCEFYNRCESNFGW